MAYMRHGSRVRSRRWLWPLVTVAIVLIACGVMVFLHLSQDNKPQVPEEIQSQLPFSPLVPARRGKSAAINYKYDSRSSILSYRTQREGYPDVVISEQTLPPQFTEIQGYQDQFLSSVIQQTSTVNTSNGVIYLGHPNKDPSKQIGVLIGQGLLIFMNPQGGELNVKQWRQLGDQLQIEKGF